MSGVEAARKEVIVFLSEVTHRDVPDEDQRTIVSTVRNEGGEIVLRTTLSLKVERLT
jgi:hypothetical protein